ncbi:hypothetical protein ACWCWD_06490 [Streptomyces sp. NPDC001493]
MTSDRILRVMALMRDIEKPSGRYFRAVRRAWQTDTDSPENKAAQARGNAALLEIEGSVRAWVAKHPDTVQPPAPLTEAQRQFLSFALDLAFDQMVSKGGFDDEDDAALAHFRLMANPAAPTP